jgi:glutathione S-transferase
MSSPRTLHAFHFSTCSHRARLMLSLLALPFEEVSVDLAAGAQREPAFLALNPVGQVPVLVEGDRVLFDSHAILMYLAEAHGGTAWWPRSAYERARLLQWLHFNCNELHNSIGTARNIAAFRLPGDLPCALGRAKAALQVLESRLSGREWLEGERASLADVACISLVSVAHEATLDLVAFPRVQSWRERMAALPRFIPMPLLKRSAAA